MPFMDSDNRMEKIRLPVTKKQMEFLKTLGVEDTLYTAEELEYIAEEVVYDCLMSRGWKPGNDFEETNEIGDMCEDLIDALNEPIRCKRASQKSER